MMHGQKTSNSLNVFVICNVDISAWIRILLSMSRHED